MEFPGYHKINKPSGQDAMSWFTYSCAHCSAKGSGATIAYYRFNDNTIIRWLMCTNCNDGSVMARDGNIYPGIPFGPKIEGLPDEIEEAYKEARSCMSVNAFIACELVCRKILMHIAVEKGAKEGDTFAAYLTHLESQGYVTPPMKGWVDLIRQHGNKATHRIDTADKGRAESTLMFTAELLRLTYEMDYLAKKYIPNP